MAKKTKEYRLEMNGFHIISGSRVMEIPDRAPTVRQLRIPIAPFTKRPVITATVYSSDSPGNPFVVVAIDLDRTDPLSLAVKITAQSVATVGSHDEYLCDFVMMGPVGKP
jgi:hypothetical protein